MYSLLPFYFLKHAMKISMYDFTHKMLFIYPNLASANLDHFNWACKVNAETRDRSSSALIVSEHEEWSIPSFKTGT